MHRVGEGTQGGMEKARRVVWMGKADKAAKAASFLTRSAFTKGDILQIIAREVKT